MYIGIINYVNQNTVKMKTVNCANSDNYMVDYLRSPTHSLTLELYHSLVITLKSTLIAHSHAHTYNRVLAH